MSQAGSPQVNKDDLYETIKVAYTHLGGGLNTLKAPCDLDRSEFSALSNYWYSYGTRPSKRPGIAMAIAAFPDGGLCVSVVVGRFNSLSYIVAQTTHGNVYAAAATAGAWTAIGTVTGGTLRGAMMFDPKTGLDTLFLVDGVDVPQMWHGPATTLVNVTTGSSTAGFLPNKPGTSTPITPAYVATLGNNSHLFYSGESTAPCAVYISDAFNPELFTTPAMQADPYGYTGSGGTFAPALIGFNDGVDGGSITGLQTLGFEMVIFKQSAVYGMVQTQLLGNVAWQVFNVSPSRGALSPLSIVAFDNFICFLSIDGVYLTYGQPTEQISKQKISVNVPTIFDSTNSGQAALVMNRTNCQAGRIGNRYLIFYGGAIPEEGVWFDFDVMRPDGLPAAGTIAGFGCAGIASLSGPQDQGLMLVGDPSHAQVGIFGQGFSDYGSAITTVADFKADAFEAEFGPAAMLRNKVPARLTLLAQPIGTVGTSTLDFSGTMIANNQGAGYGGGYAMSIALPAVATPAPSNPGFPAGWAALPCRPQSPVVGYSLQVQIVEESAFPYLLGGIVWELDAREVSR